MSIPTRVRITLAIILGIGLGTGTLIFGVLLYNGYRDEQAGFISFGAALLAGSVSALIVHLKGGFSDLDDQEP